MLSPAVINISRRRGIPRVTFACAEEEGVERRRRGKERKKIERRRGVSVDTASIREGGSEGKAGNNREREISGSYVAAAGRVEGVESHLRRGLTLAGGE